MTKRIVVTGAAGYIGSVLVPQLLRRGHAVTAIDRFFFGADTLAPHPRLSAVRADTRQLEAQYLDNVHAVIDLAAVSNDPAGDHFADTTWAINQRARLRTARLARDAGVRHYLLPSSCSVYGAADHVLDETGDTRPQTHYARANLAAEHAISMLADARFRVTRLRLATVFGPSPRMRLDLAINAMTQHAWTSGTLALMRDGSQYRPFVHVRDVADAICHLLACEEQLGDTNLFNVGSNDNNITLARLAAAVASRVEWHTGRTVNQQWYGDPDQRNYRVNFSRIEDVTGWRAHWSITAGIDDILTQLEAGRILARPQTSTLAWYKHLEEQSTCYPDLLLHGGMLVLPGDSEHAEPAPAHAEDSIHVG